MSSCPACAGPQSRTFSCRSGEKVFLCPETGIQPSAVSSQPSAFSSESSLKSDS
jgi:hypothetical protein